MPAVSPTLEGFRAAFRRPIVSFAEIAWRWSVGATAIALVAFGVFEYFATLPVTGGEILFLQTRQPILVAQAIAHILKGGWSRALHAGVLAGLALVLLWMFAASLGRMATLAGLLEYFRGNGLREDLNADQNKPSRNAFRSLLRLNFLRIVVGIAAVSGVIGAGILGSFASPSAGLAFLIWALLATLVGLACWGLNWFLSLANIFAIRDQKDAMAAISAAVFLCRERAGAVFAVSFWTGLAHLAAFVAATSAVSLPLALAATVSWRLVAVAMILITLLYFAVADWIYMARAAGYICIVEMPETLPVSTLIPDAPLPPPSRAIIDQQELILSDIPHLAPGS